jgi:predicted helicase
MKNFFHENIGLATTRKIPDIFGITTFICNNVADIHLIGDQNYFFPLYLYHKKDNPKKQSITSIMMLFEPQADYGIRKPNLSHVLVEKLTKEYKKAPSPEEIFCYIYAVLHSETYRTKYAEFLKIDFPKVPFTRDYKLFKKMSEYGNRLVDLHLLKSPELDSPIARFQGKGDNRVEKPKYDEKAEMAHLNKAQYFEGIPPDVWTYQIGGYQVCDKWLKDRKERILSLDEIQTYCRIVTAIQKTIEIQKDIDSFYKEIEKTV